jgi:hypothetical protein
VDGALFFFEHDVLLFQIQLPDFLIPGPFTYSATLDAIILTNSNLEIECYKYSSLQTATNNNIAMQKAQQEGGGKKAVEPLWITNIGEQANQIVIHANNISQKKDLVVVGEQTIYILNESDGRIRYQRRLEYTPSCIKTYHVPRNKDIYETETRLGKNVASAAL